jgi:hypothetical protein
MRRLAPHTAHHKAFESRSALTLYASQGEMKSWVEHGGTNWHSAVLQSRVPGRAESSFSPQESQRERLGSDGRVLHGYIVTGMLGNGRSYSQ